MDTMGMRLGPVAALSDSRLVESTLVPPLHAYGERGLSCHLDLPNKTEGGRHGFFLSGGTGS